LEPESITARIDALALLVRSEGGVFEAAYHEESVAPIAHALAELWEKNEAWRAVLDGGQQRWLEAWRDSDGSWYNGSGRQRGKSLAHLAIVDWHNREWAGSRCRWMGLTGETAEAIVKQAVVDLFVTCPTHLKPQWQSGDLVWPNGSTLIVGGTDAKSFRRARGFGRISIDVRDEYGFWQRVADTDGALSGGLIIPGPNGKPGRILYGTTPADTPSHESEGTAETHEAAGRLWRETIYDNPRADVESTLRSIEAKTGQTREQVLRSTSWRREYLGERVVEEKHAAVPRWAELGAGLPSHPSVVEVQRPEYVDYYGGGDFGKRRDPHAYLLAWFDFPSQLLYFEHELEMPSVSTTGAEWAQAMKELERRAWGADAWGGTLLGAEEWDRDFKNIPEYLRRAVSKDAPRQPYLRVGDDDDTMLKELVQLHGIAMFPTAKHDKHVRVDEFNSAVGRGQVKVHPRCVRLIQQMRGTIWNEQRTEWVRTERDHGDVLDTALYIFRNVRWHRDCRPKHIDSAQRAIMEIQEKARANAAGWKEWKPRR
jgi:hypothetical protein